MRFRFGLPARITLLALLLAVIGGLLLAGDEKDRLHALLLEERSADLATALHVEQARLHQSIELLRQDVLFLAGTPPVSGIVRASANKGIDPRDKNTYAAWEARMQEIFAAFLRTHPEYFQASYIGAAGEGRELVRVDNRDGRIVVVSGEALQARGGMDYFKIGLISTSGRVHLSNFMLYRERGKIEEPHRPVMNAVTTVFDAGGHVFGMVVLSKDLRRSFAAPVAELPHGVQSYIADQQGHYLQHPDAKRAFAFELGSEEKITDDFPALAPMFETRTQQNELPFQQAGSKDGYLAAVRVFYDASDPTRFLLLANHVSTQMVARQASDVRLSPTFGDVFKVLLLAGGIFWLALHLIFSPLRAMVADLRGLGIGGNKGGAMKKGMAEIGELAEAIQVFRHKPQDGETVTAPEGDGTST